MTKTLQIHHEPEPFPDTHVPDPFQDTFSKTFLGFWLYLITDCLLFASLFITYAVLHTSTNGGPSSKDLFDLTTAFHETLLLLLSSVTSGFALIAITKEKIPAALLFLAATFLLGAAFIGIEIGEFTHLFERGHTFQESAFLSAFFTLLGTHGTHVLFGLLWISVMIGQLAVLGITEETFRRLFMFGLFWHFLDLIWIFIFTFVYLMGVI